MSSAPAVVALDVGWNLFIAVFNFILFGCLREHPSVPLKVWIGGYASQHSLHVALVSLRTTIERTAFLRISTWLSVVKRFESVNTMVSFLWWIVGFYWVVSGGEKMLLHNDPRLRLAGVFASKVFKTIFCVVLACLIGIGLCCCLPCISIFYAVDGQKGASDADLSILPKYNFDISNVVENAVGGGRMVPVETSNAYLVSEHIVWPDDATCCICREEYEDGAELDMLPCNHHFHSSCVAKWLKINATCPICWARINTLPKYNRPFFLFYIFYVLLYLFCLKVLPSHPCI